MCTRMYDFRVTVLASVMFTDSGVEREINSRACTDAIDFSDYLTKTIEYFSNKLCYGNGTENTAFVLTLSGSINSIIGVIQYKNPDTENIEILVREFQNREMFWNCLGSLETF